MDNRDRSNIGDEIRRSVEDAIGSMDFEQLNKTISDTVSYALDEARKNLSKASSFAENSGAASGQSRRAVYDDQDTPERRMKGEEVHRTRPAASRPAEEPGYRAFASYKSGKPAKAEPRVAAVRVNQPGRVAGILYTVFGSIGIGVTAVLFLVVLLISLTVRPLAGAMAGTSVFLLALSAVFGTMLGVGNTKRGRIRRLKAYVSEAGSRKFCSVEELSRVVGKPKQFIVRDLEKMIAGGYLPEAHLDGKKTCLMLDHETYRQYREAEQSYEERKRLQMENARASAEINAKAGNCEISQEPDELQKMISAGREYAEILREANDAIPGERISEKLTKLEHVIRKIFETVEKHPEQMDEMEKFMDYYLPTTVKLVNAYRDFDSVETAGSNVASAKQEIENTLDTINQAFERLLDNLYQDAALDASTDASVLQTMLKSEGYTDNDFRRNDNE